MTCWLMSGKYFLMILDFTPPSLRRENAKSWYFISSFFSTSSSNTCWRSSSNLFSFSCSEFLPWSCLVRVWISCCKSPVCLWYPVMRTLFWEMPCVRFVISLESVRKRRSLSVSSFFFSLLSVVSLCFSGRLLSCLCFS